MALTFFQNTSQGPVPAPVQELSTLNQQDLVWVDLLSPDAAEESAVEARFNIDAPSDIERAALEESARFYVDNGSLVMNVTVMARAQPDAKVKAKLKNLDVQHYRETLSFFLTTTTLITVRNCQLRAFEVNAGRASVDLAGDRSAGDVLVSLVESLIQRSADFLAASARELEELNLKVLISHKQVRLETVLRRLGQLGAGASQTRDSLASLSRLVQFAMRHSHRFNIPTERLALVSTDTGTLERQAEALKTDLTFALDATLGLVSARQNDTLRAMAIVTLIFVPPTLIASVFGMNFEAMTIFQDQHGPWWAVLFMAVSSLSIITVARWGKWL